MSVTAAGYSGTPLAGRLGFKPGQRVAYIDAPDGFEALLGALPAGVTVRAVGLPIGLVDTKVCAIDETWSGLRLVIRKELR